MPVKTVRLYTLALIISDALAILGAFSVAYILRVQFDSRPLVAEVYAEDFLITFLLLLPFWLLIFLPLGLYSPQVYQKRLTEYGKIMIGSFIGILLVLGYAFLIDEPVFPARLVAVYATVLVFLLLLVGRELLRLVRDTLYLFNKGVQRVLIIGNNHATADIAKRLSETLSSGFRVVAVAGKSPGINDIKHYRTAHSALKDIDQLKIDRIIQTSLFDEPERNQQIMSAAQARHIGYSFIPGESEFYSGKNQIDVFLGYPIISVYQTPLVGWGEVIKRIFDLTLVILSSPFWLLLFAIVATFQKVFDNGPVFFISQRLGHHGKMIGVYKFRTMQQKYSGADAAEIFRQMGREDLATEYEKTRKIKNDPRVTWFGKFLRATSIDEMPQILNVLKGDMSLVGPRPIIKEEKPFYKNRAPLLFSVRPGMTGLWQVSGRSDLSFNERVELELYYAQNWSFWLDIKILFKTLGAVVFKKRSRLMRRPKVAIVTDWITDMGGVARVDLALHEAFPEAPIYTSVYEPDELARQYFDGLDIRPTWLQKLPRSLRKLQRLFPMLRVKAFRDLDLSEFDIIISSSSAESKQVRKTRPDQIHICYCHTPIRYYWSHYKEYKKDPGLGWLNPIARLTMPILVPPLKKADYQAAQEVDVFIANSSIVQQRIKQYYKKPSTVVHPPVDAERFTKAAQPLDKRRGYLAHGRQVPYKRIDLAIKACNELGLPLTVSGRGPENDNLRSIAGETVTFVSDLSDKQVAELFGRSRAFIFPAEEDFGIVQVEALAAGTPVIACGKGGSQDIIKDGEGGITFRKQNEISLVNALKEAEKTSFEPANLQRIAKRFHKTLFISKIKKIVRDNS